MIDVVFISDLHLHPQDHQILNYFQDFIAWARTSVKTVYILGDFFHAWAGDDSINDWSRGIADQLASLSSQGISLYYMPGNRDFLLGSEFAHLTGWKVLSDPSLINLGKEQVMLAHGDAYCTLDKTHQRFRRLTRNKIFPALFLSLPLRYREALVNKVRSISENNVSQSKEKDVVAQAVIQAMLQHKVTTLVHGHTHKPGLTSYKESRELKRYVLSDWDDIPKLLCYDNTKGFYFTQY